jgi:hypothetical protein
LIRDSLDPWAHFLHARKLLIDAMLEEGQRPAAIANTLSMDATQVTLIAMTDVELMPTGRKSPKSGKVRAGWTVEGMTKAIERAEALSPSESQKG